MMLYKNGAQKLKIVWHYTIKDTFSRKENIGEVDYYEKSSSDCISSSDVLVFDGLRQSGKHIRQFFNNCSGSTIGAGGKRGSGSIRQF